MGLAIQAGERTELRVAGMNCAGCARHVTEALQSVPGVAGAEVSLPEARARVRWQSGTAENVAALEEAVRAAGYEAQSPAEHSCHSEPAHASWRTAVLIGVAGTVPLMLGEWVFHWGAQRWFEWAALALALPVQVFGGARFYRGAWRQLKAGGSNMDTLVALGSTAAFGYSLWALFSGAGGHLYFMEAAAIITLVSVGHWMEARASRHAEKSMRALFELAPETARQRLPDGSEISTPAARLHPGDVVLLRPGDRVPTDGKLIEGRCSIDESMLTGESLPLEKGRGDTVYAGTINIDGNAAAAVTATGESTAMANIVAAVERAQSSRASIQRLADRVSNIFVPLVIAVALAAGLWWGLFPAAARRVVDWMPHYFWTGNAHSSPLAGAIFSAVAVLIVACPCAMGLATPIALMAGTNAAARRGILIRDGAALEKAGAITILMADKTGTITTGKPEIVAQWGNDFAMAAALAAGSNHPLSRAVAAMTAPAAPLQDWREVRGSGVEGKTPAGAAARLGSPAWLRSSGVKIADDSFAGQWTNEGATILGFSIDTELRALIALRDTIQPGAAEVVRRLQANGLKVLLVTGDNPRTARAIAQQAGIDPANVFAEVRPEGKAELVRRLQQNGRVAFVGDGINDAPALEQADLGIAVSEASQIASEAANIILLKSGIEAIPEALGLARATLRTVKQNLFWAFFYNAAAIPLAALGFLSPILCAAAMGMSDLVVIGNALRLTSWRLRGK